MINTYDELKNLTIEQLEENKAEKGTFKDYTYYVLNDWGNYGTCLFIVGNNNIIYIDEQIQYNSTYSQEEVITKMKDRLQSQIFNLNEFNVVTSYRDYRNKRNFLNNVYQNLYNAVSIYTNNEELTAEQQELKEKGVLATRISFCYYKNEEELTQLYTLLDNLEKALLECLKDDQQENLINIVYDFYMSLENDEGVFIPTRAVMFTMLEYGDYFTFVGEYETNYSKEYDKLIWRL